MNRKGMHTLLAAFIAVVMVVAMVMPVLAQQGSQLQITDFEGYADQPDVAVDSQGNVHIVYFYADIDWQEEDDHREIWYTMLDNDGNALIDHTQITPEDGYPSTQPAIAVDSQDRVHVVWRGPSAGTSSDCNEIRYCKIDPSLDDQDGSSADAGTIIVVDEKQLTNIDEWYVQHPSITIDSNDDIHIVWEWYDAYIYYMKVDSNGNELVAITEVRDGSSCLWYARPDVAVDSNDNPHIAWNDYYDTDTYETYYAMLDGSDGSILIDTSILSPDDDESSKRQSIVVDAEDMVHVVWHDYRQVDYNEIFYSKLDPSQDDQSGDAADESAISVISNRMLTPDDADYSWNPQLALECGYLHMAWSDGYVEAEGEVYYMAVDTDGNVVIPGEALTTGETVSYTTSNRDNTTHIAVDENGKAHMVWCDNRTEDREIWYTSYQGPSCTPRPVGGEAYPLNTVGIIAPWIVLAVAAVAGIFVISLRKVS